MIKIDNSVLAFDPANPKVASGQGNKDFAGKLQAAMNTKDGKRLYSACQDMESVFLSTVFQTIRNTIPKGGFINQGFADDVFQSMLYDEYAKQMSQTGNTGIAQMLFKQLSAQL